MNEKDKIIIKDSVDAIVSNIPGLNIAWDLSQALLGAGLKLRQQRALEWVEMVRDNPDIFTEQILSDPEFQDGFVYFLEKFLIERNKEKRNFLKNIFLGFAESGKKENYELEKFAFILSQLNIADIEVLKFVDVKTSNSYQVFDDAKCLENIQQLINVGILYADPSPRVGPVHSPFVFTSHLGRSFIKYLKR